MWHAWGEEKCCEIWVKKDGSEGFAINTGIILKLNFMNCDREAST
jgi:hypothetical protein